MHGARHMQPLLGHELRLREVAEEPGGEEEQNAENPENDTHEASLARRRPGTWPPAAGEPGRRPGSCAAARAGTSPAHRLLFRDPRVILCSIGSQSMKRLRARRSANVGA